MLGNDVLKTYFNDVKHSYLQIESYDSFVQNKIFSSIMDNEVNIEVEQKRYIITFHNIFIDKPMFDDKYITPDECRLRDLSYETSVQVDINVLITDTNTNRVLYSNIFNRFNLFNLPVMIGSSLCNLTNKQGECVNDDGGYFIIKGKERVIISQERINYNQIYVYEQGKIMSEVRSIKDGADYSVLFQLSISESMDNAFANLSYITQEIPLGIFLKALNVDIVELVAEERDDQFREWIGKLLNPYSLVEPHEALDYISQYVVNKVEQSKKIAYTNQILTNELLPHLGIESDNRLKGLYILMMLRKTYNTAIGKRKWDHRDHLSNKRVECVGDLINYLVKGFLKRFVKMIEQNITKKQEFSNPVSMFNRFNFSQRMYQCFSTGTWGLPKSTYIRQGVCQVLSRLSFLGYLSHIRRIAVPIAKDSRNTEVRQVHSSSYGFVDVVESPEGQSAGIVKNFGLVTKISEHIDSTIFHDILVSLFPNLLPPSLDETIIYINGSWIGNIETYKVSEFIQLFKSFRMLDIIHKDICISYNDIDDEIYINTDGGRILRAVINNQKGVYERTRQIIDKNEENAWEILQKENVIVFIDSDEADMSYISMEFNSEYDPKYDYIEIHPSALLGTCSNWTIFPEHSQAPRNLYSAAQMKQGMSMYALSHGHRFATTAHVLDYPQSRFVSTQFSRETGAEEMANGANAIVAVMTYGGWNQEDSLILNKSAIDRGLFRATTYKSISSSEKKKGTYLTEIIEWVPPDFRRHQFDYSKLGMDGIVNVGEYVTQNDVLVGRLVHESNQPKKDCSLICPNNLEGIVDKVMVTLNAAGYKHVKIKVRKTRVPEIGDKAASATAQKGTLSTLMPQEDMPFTPDGISPDVIINPHAIPSRMTINMMMEILLGKSAAYSGELQDGTAFCHSGEEIVEKASKILKDAGYDPMGWETMTNGMTGEQLKAKIFIGPSYYMRLKHLVSDKMHCLSMDHEVLTDNGWKYFSDITMKDKIATLKNNELVYDHPISLLYYPDHEGEMYSVKNSQLDLRVTSNHRMFVSRQYSRKRIWLPHELRPAKEIMGKNLKYRKNAEWNCEDYQFILPSVEQKINNSRIDTIQSKKVDMDSWLTFFGIWLAEGWVNQNTRSGHYTISISVNKQRVKDVLYPAVEKLGYNYNVNQEKLRIKNFQLYEYMKQFSVGAPNKFMPDWVWKLSKEQARKLSYSMILGDGSFGKLKQSWYSTSSKKLADDFMRLLLHCGWSGNQSIQVKKGTESFIKGRKIQNNYDIIKISVVKSKNFPEVNHSHTSVCFEEKMEYSKEPVFCLQVPSEVFYVRRNGKGVWTGNSRSRGNVQKLTRQPCSGRSRDGKITCRKAIIKIEFLLKQNNSLVSG